jgi:hypothetical protein
MNNPTHRLSTDHSTVVDSAYHWISVDDIPPPMGPKLQLINKYNGVAVYGNWAPGGYWTHWAPLPTWKREPKNNPKQHHKDEA